MIHVTISGLTLRGNKRVVIWWLVYNAKGVVHTRKDYLAFYSKVGRKVNVLDKVIVAIKKVCAG